MAGNATSLRTAMPLPDLDHATYLRRAFAIAAAAADSGSHPFGAVLVDGDGTVLMEQGNAYLPDHDMTGHAERVLATRASQRFRPAELAEATLYSSAEPCAMCAGAAYWAGIGRIVYGLSENALRQITGNHPENPTLDLPCRMVLESGQRPVEVIGPLLENEAAEPHRSFWAKR
ncbi:MAG: Guanine deaminase [Proteobacteria bacterium]|nr:Guanine deaminase [Pseudomonadota bacterium]